MKTITDTSTIDIRQITGMVLNPSKHEEFCYFNFPHEDEGVTYYYNIPSLSNSYTSTVADLRSEYANSWVSCDFRNICYSMNNQICAVPNVGMYEIQFYQIPVQKYYNSSVATYPTVIVWEAQENDLVELDIRNLLDSLEDEEFETEIDNYTVNFANIIQSRGRSVIGIINKLIDRSEISDNLMYKMLQLIGRLTDETTYSDRFMLLLRCLEDKGAVIRDGAVIGLSFMDDKDALPYLAKAFSKEIVPTLKRNIEVAMDELKI